MFYLGIDQHRRQLTIALRDEKGDLLLQRQVSTNWERIREFLSGLRGALRRGRGLCRGRRGVRLQRLATEVAGGVRL